MILIIAPASGLGNDDMMLAARMSPDCVLLPQASQVCVASLLRSLAK